MKFLLPFLSLLGSTCLAIPFELLTRESDLETVDIKTASGNVKAQVVLEFKKEHGCWERDKCGKARVKKREAIRKGLDDMVRMIPGTYYGDPDWDSNPDIFYNCGSSTLAYTSNDDAATTWAHELMHIASFGKTIKKSGEKYMRDYKYPENGNHRGDKWKAYRVRDVKWLAFGSTTPDYAGANNPQSYALLALGNYLLSKIDFFPSEPTWDDRQDPPPAPKKDDAVDWDVEISGAPACDKLETVDDDEEEEEEEEPRGLTCLWSDFSAPKNKMEDGSTSEEQIFNGWYVSRFDIKQRGSMWISGAAAAFDQCKEGTVKEDDCRSVLTRGVKQCYKSDTVTHGITAHDENCIDYAIEFSSSIHEDDPPWNQHIISYPPPDEIKSELSPAAIDRPEVVCSKERGGKWTKEDADAAIEQHCGNDLPFGKADEYTEKGSVKISASFQDSTEKRGFSGPYPEDKKGYCEAFPREHKSQDDCRYAFRKMSEKVGDHAFCLSYYRCVGYLMIAGEFSDPLSIDDGT
ncbi:hypothetical protein P154DRAFT_582692 [Amniculicola lignicola CBS 123094]|uniref:Lysine-specific metallo-endopeptidase domain-containing protein n=1 Tax=Amniculicola lignicola CBS 123094 TaxID=1392246 RepID=A0A6A5VVK9_9PLEO|nr:hypothetical protein P154DRAFT_582692 [Amniculicola lignicola CBS 123094]